MPAAQLRLGLAANRLQHETPDAALFSWLRACSSTIRELGAQLHTVGRTHDAIVREGMLQGYSGLIRYPYGREGGLMKLDSFFEPFTITHQTILESGLLISFLLHADNVPPDVKQEWEALKGVIQSEDQKGLSKAFLKFETAMTKKGEDPVLAYMDALFAG